MNFGHPSLLPDKTLYVSDLDGTLLTSDVRVSEKSLRIINALVEQGMRFTYATARGLVTARKVTTGLLLNIPIIAHNGTFIMDPGSGEVLHGCYFDDSDVSYFRTLLDDRGIHPLVYSMIDGAERVSWHTAHENAGIRNYLESRRGDLRLRPVESVDAAYEGRLFSFLCIGAEGELDELYDTIKRDDRYYSTYQQDMYLHDYWLELTPRDATKAEAVRRLRDMLSCDCIISFGDAVNDLPMFAASDEAYAVANAIPELKAAATAVIGGNDDDGVAKWLERSIGREI